MLCISFWITTTSGVPHDFEVHNKVTREQVEIPNNATDSIQLPYKDNAGIFACLFGLKKIGFCT